MLSTILPSHRPASYDRLQNAVKSLSDSSRAITCSATRIQTDLDRIGTSVKTQKAKTFLHNTPKSQHPSCRLPIFHYQLATSQDLLPSIYSLNNTTSALEQHHYCRVHVVVTNNLFQSRSVRDGWRKRQINRWESRAEGSTRQEPEVA